MSKELFEVPIARARQRESPPPEGRRGFLSHLQALGVRANLSLRAVAGRRRLLRNPSLPGR